tara:strand:- start:70 stop:351 length:282 start_codon:yes stop_codon:yes gene_type:complete
MSIVHYDIRDFLWVKDNNQFYADGWDLYDAEGDYRSAFPNQKEQFVIKNYQTENFRRFTFQKEVTDPFGTYWMFESEDGYKCMIDIGEKYWLT